MRREPPLSAIPLRLGLVSEALEKPRRRTTRSRDEDDLGSCLGWLAGPLHQSHEPALALHLASVGGFFSSAGCETARARALAVTAALTPRLDGE